MVAENGGTGDRVVVIGASGGIGRALADLAQARGAQVIRLSRPDIEVADEAGIAAAAEAAGDGLSHVIVASGLLHRDGIGPERDWRQLSADWMLESFRVNAVLPALVAKHFLPRLRRDGPALFALLSARVGSIGDNRLGGWHSYRASKAAANQLVRTLSVELKRKNPGAAIVALHPGTVDTGMSKPFQRNVTPEKLFTPAAAAGHLWNVMEGIGPAQSGGFLAWDGSEIAW
jgi:NAD(P)-dependent dehydrogenase (short-subunit alcohol dehydrogenase family)